MSPKCLLVTLLFAVTCLTIDAGGLLRRRGLGQLREKKEDSSNEGLGNTSNRDAVKVDLLNPAVGNSEDTSVTSKPNDQSSRRRLLLSGLRSKRRAHLLDLRSSNKATANKDSGSASANNSSVPSAGNAAVANSHTTDTERRLLLSSRLRGKRLAPLYSLHLRHKASDTTNEEHVADSEEVSPRTNVSKSENNEPKKKHLRHLAALRAKASLLHPSLGSLLQS